MLSTNDISQWANNLICPIIKGLKAYGVAKTAASPSGKFEPYIYGKALTIDDTYPAILYHKEQSVSSTSVPGFGRDQNLQSTFQMSMILYFNENKCGQSADALYTFIQSAITGVLKAEDYKSVRVNVTSAILNDAQVWRQEYGNSPYKLSDAQRLIQINYNIVFVVDKTCIAIPKC